MLDFLDKAPLYLGLLVKVRLKLLVLTHVGVKCFRYLFNLLSGIFSKLLHLLFVVATFRVLVLLQLLVKLLEVFLLALKLFILVCKLLDKRLNVLLKIVNLLLLARGQVTLLDFSISQLLL